MKQVYLLTYPTGKIYVGKDSTGSYRYFGSPDIGVVNADFMMLPPEARKEYSVKKTILWESDTSTEKELSAVELGFHRKYHANDPTIGDNRWPRFKAPTKS
jgi:hypothetical protein